MDNAEEQVKRRKHPRYEISGPVKIWHPLRKQYLGVVANLSVDGLMLASSEALESERLYALELHLPSPIAGTQKIPLTVDCLWVSEADISTDVFWSGCQIIDCSDSDIEIIAALIASQNINNHA